MSTPPRVTRTELDVTMHRIVGRRQKVDDPDLWRWSDDPAEALDYLRKYSTPAIPKWVRRADVVDGLTLNVWLWWEDKRREYALLAAGEKLDMFHSELGSPLGIQSRQGTRARIDRLRALIRYDRPDEKLSRAERRLAAEQVVQQDIQTVWLAAHADQLRAVTERLVAAADRHEVEERDWLEELEVDCDNGRFTPASIAVLGMAVAEIRTAPQVVVLDITHNVHRVLRHADELRTAFTTLTTLKSTTNTRE